MLKDTLGGRWGGFKEVFGYMMPLAMGRYLAKMNSIPAPSIPASMRPYIKNQVSTNTCRAGEGFKGSMLYPGSQSVMGPW